jgi:PAS domain S-box-containing protein
VPRGFFYEAVLRREYPGIKVLPLRDTIDTMKAVSFGTADAALGELAVFNHLMAEQLLTNVSVAGEVNIGDHEMSLLNIATRKDLPLLASILSKGVRAIGTGEANAIRQKWLANTVSGAVIAAPSTDAAALAARRVWWFIAVGLIVLVLLIPVLLQRLSGSREREWLSSAVVRRIGAVAVALFLVVVMGLAWYSLERVQDRLRNDIGSQLSIINNVVHQALQAWLDGRRELVLDLAHDPEVQEAARALLAAPRNAQALRAAPAMSQLRTLLAPRLQRLNAKGLFIIAPDRISIASMRDANLGTENLIAQQRSGLMDCAFSGETVFIPPIVSDVPLRGQDGHLVQRAPTMFFATPLRDADGEVMAVFTLRFDPAFELTRITRTGRPGESGETYAIDRNGRLLTESRFEDFLIEPGSEPNSNAESGIGKTSLQGLRVADPGGNLLSGHLPRAGRSEWPLTLMADEVTRGRSGRDVVGYRDYRGVPVIGAWLWSSELSIGLTTEIDADEAMAPYLALRDLVIGVLGVTVLLALLLTGLSVWLGDRTKARLERLVGERTRELKKLAQAVEQSPLCVVITDADGNIEHVNPAFTQVTGYRPDEVIGKNPRVLKSGETSPEQYADLWATIAEGRVWRGEIRNRRKNGELYWGAISIAPVTDESGTVTHFVAMTDDITEAKKVELALQESESRFRHLFENTPVVYQSLDYDGNIVDVNPRWLEMVGYERDEVIGQKFNEFWTPETRDIFPQRFCGFKDSGCVNNVELHLVRKNGDPLTVLLTGRIQTDKNGVFVRTHCIIVDITERTKAEQALREGEEKLRSMLGNVPGVVYRCLLDEHWTMLFISDEIEVLSGYPAADFRGADAKRTFAQIMHPDDVAPIAEQVRSAVDEHRTYSVEYRIIDRQGKTHHVYAKGQTVYAEDGTPQFLDGSIFDISEKRQAELALRRSEQHFRTLFNVTAIPLVSVDADENMMINPKFTEVLGYTDEDIPTLNEW